jgi:hypothetical protein
LALVRFRHFVVGVPTQVPAPVPAAGVHPGAASQASSPSDSHVGFVPVQAGLHVQPHMALASQSGRRVHDDEQNVVSA